MRLWVTGVVLLGLSALCIASVQDPATASKPSKSKLDQLAWLAGSWKSEGEGRSTEEHWTGPAGGLMLGVHRDVRGKRASFEFLRIEERGEAVHYYASPSGAPATRFEMTEVKERRVVFENPKHDFPQRIVYWLEDGRLHARAEAVADGKLQKLTWKWEPSSLR